MAVTARGNETWCYSVKLSRWLFMAVTARGNETPIRKAVCFW